MTMMMMRGTIIHTYTLTILTPPLSNRMVSIVSIIYWEFRVINNFMIGFFNFIEFYIFLTFGFFFNFLNKNICFRLLSNKFYLINFILSNKFFLLKLVRFSSQFFGQNFFFTFLIN